VRALVSWGTEFIVVTLPLHYSRLPLAARLIEARLKFFIRRQVKDRELARKLTPDYGLGCKRPSISNHYLRAFNRDNVELITDPIDRVTEKGVRTAGGTEREVDVLILATGFRLAFDPENFRRTPVRGRDGFDLATQYQENRLKAYESISLPRLPNHFMIFGPYGWTGASWHVLVQTASTHIVRVLEEARRRGADVVEVSDEATDRYHETVLENLQGGVWQQPSCATANSYYFDHHGDTPYMRPTSGRAARKAARSFPLSDYHYERLGRTPEPAEREKVAA
jgi:cation diffusion facilitator CzcD-associated flavoprotein CzcO